MGSANDSSAPGGTGPRAAAEPVALAAPAPAPPAVLDLAPVTPAELRVLVHAGENDSDACERILAQVSRAEGALELAIGDGLAAITVGDRLLTLGFSCLRDYAREVLDLGERNAQALAYLSRGLRSRPVLRAAVRSGELGIRKAETILPVAREDAEAGWVELGRHATVRALEAAVKAARSGAEVDDETWLRFRVRLKEAERAVVDEALEIAGRLLPPGSSRAQRLEAMAMEYIGGHALAAGDGSDDERPGGAFRRERRGATARREETLERETERWSFLPSPVGVPAPEVDFDALGSPVEIDRRLRELAALRTRWDAILGYCAYMVRRSGLWKVAGFDSFEQYCRERLGLSARTVEQRAALERRLWQAPALRAARDAGVSYERLRVLARLPDRQLAAWVERARSLTVLALRDEVADRDEAQTRAAGMLGARVPGRVADLLEVAFWAVRVLEGCLLAAGSCLVRLARHFVETWKAQVKHRTPSQRIRERDRHRCRVPGCSRPSVQAHHLEYRSHGGSDDPANQGALCAYHHLVGIHRGYMRVTGQAPEGLVWELLRIPGGPVPFYGGAAPPVPLAEVA